MPGVLLNNGDRRVGTNGTSSSGLTLEALRELLEPIANLTGEDLSIQFTIDEAETIADRIGAKLGYTARDIAETLKPLISAIALQEILSPNPLCGLSCEEIREEIFQPLAWLDLRNNNNTMLGQESLHARIVDAAVIMGSAVGLAVDATRQRFERLTANLRSGAGDVDRSIPPSTPTRAGITHEEGGDTGQHSPVLRAPQRHSPWVPERRPAVPSGPRDGDVRSRMRQMRTDRADRLDRAPGGGHAEIRGNRRRGH